MSLRAATAVFAVGFFVHHLDHVRRGYGVVDDGFILGRTIAAMLVAGLFTLVLTRHAAAPSAAVVVGVVVLVGLVVVRLVPPFGLPSDHLGAAGTDALTWIVVLFELAGAGLVVVAGLREPPRRAA